MKNNFARLTLLILAITIIGLLAPWYTVAQSVPCYREQGGAKWVAGLIGSEGCEWEMQSGATLDIQSGVTETHANNPTFSGNPVFSGTPNFSGNPTIGADGNYALGIATAGQEIDCGTTDTFTATTNITTSNVTSPTYVLVSQVTAPITTAAYLHVNDPTGITVTLTSLNNTFDAGTTGIAVHYCIVGNE